MRTEKPMDEQTDRHDKLDVCLTVHHELTIY